MTHEERFEKMTATATLAQDAQLLTFCLEDQEYALDIANVVQVVRMVAITHPPPKAPQFVEGMINLRGKVIPVVNLRKRFGRQAKPYGLDNHLLIAQTNGHTMALIVDVVNEFVTYSGLPVRWAGKGSLTSSAGSRGFDSFGGGQRGRKKRRRDFDRQSASKRVPKQRIW